MLGDYPPKYYQLGPTATTSVTFGLGSGPILLNSVACDGSEARLVDCRAGTDLYFSCGRYSCTSCTHAHDAGVRCSTQTGKMKIYLQCEVVETKECHYTLLHCAVKISTEYSFKK